MFSYLFNTFLYNPIYNLLVYLITVIPGGDVGIAVIILTIFIKLVLFPVSLKAVRTQMKMKVVEPELKKVQEMYKDNKEELSRKTFEIYRKNKINPFSSIVVLFIQIPVIFALYFAILKGLPVIKTDILYTFIHAPEHINMNFLGILDVSKNKGVILALIAGITQFYQAKLAMPAIAPAKNDSKEVSFKDEMMRGMHIQVRYVMPIVTFFIAYGLVSVIAIYWTVSNLFAIGQEFYIRKKVRLS
ncbi:MAG: YidC/Oxa1 family membrane protein insertase [bacterium]